MNNAFLTALIIFVRNPVLGHVKTRLAKGIGEEKALAVYELLLMHTLQITQELNCRKFVYYADSIAGDDGWNSSGYTKRQQYGQDLGERMSNAFKELFAQGFQRVLIIGSDCYQLDTPTIHAAIESLAVADTVIGPTFDGGYYLLGMNYFIPDVFINKPWSSDQVASQTLKDIASLSASVYLLPQLHDVDELDDLVKVNFPMKDI